MSQIKRISLNEVMNDLKSEIVKINKIINNNLVLISSKLVNVDQSSSITKETKSQLKAEIKRNDLMIRSLGDELEALSIRILLLQAPVSRDLRYVISSFRMIYDLQRISRDAYNAFSDIIDAFQSNNVNLKPQIIHIIDILNNSKMLLKIFIEIYQQPISEQLVTYEDKIDESIELDNKIDQSFMSNTKILIENTTDGKLSPASGYSLISSFRSLERLGDHCCNLIERAIYIQSGEKVLVK